MMKKVQKDSLGRKLTEKSIQASILSWLKRNGVFHWRQNAGLLKAGRRRIRLGPKGISDIIVLLPPGCRFVGLEVKVPGRYQNPDQKAFQANIEALGGMYFVVHSKEEAQSALTAAGFIPKAKKGREACQALLQAGCNISIRKPRTMEMVRKTKKKLKKESTTMVKCPLDPWRL